MDAKGIDSVNGMNTIFIYYANEASAIANYSSYL